MHAADPADLATLDPALGEGRDTPTIQVAEETSGPSLPWFHPVRSAAGSLAIGSTGRCVITRGCWVEKSTEQERQRSSKLNRLLTSARHVRSPYVDLPPPILLTATKQSHVPLGLLVVSVPPHVSAPHFYLHPRCEGVGAGVGETVGDGVQPQFTSMTKMRPSAALGAAIDTKIAVSDFVMPVMMPATPLGVQSFS